MPAPRRILIVRTSALGDVARSVPALVQLHHAFPDADIDWLVHERYVEAIAAHPDLHAAIGFPRQRLTALPRLLRRLRRKNYDLAVDLEGQFRSALLTRLCGAPTRVGYANAREMGYLAYNLHAYVSPQLHAVDRMLTLLHATNLAPRDVAADMRLYVPPRALQWFSEHFAGQDGYIAIAPTAAWSNKCWPIENYIAIARRLRERGQRVVVLAAPRERDQVQPLIDAAQTQFQPTTVGQMMAIIDHCRLLICNDSAPLHIAVGLGRPIVALFGPTDPALVGPYRSPGVIQPPHVRPQDMVAYRHRREDQSLIARISVNMAWRRIEAALYTSG